MYACCDHSYCTYTSPVSLYLSLSTRIDAMLEETLSEKGIPSSQIPGRPKKWRSKCMEILETSIANKYTRCTDTIYMYYSTI